MTISDNYNNYRSLSILAQSDNFLLLILITLILFSMGLVVQLCPTLCDPMDCSLPVSSVYKDFPGKNSGVGSHCLLHGSFLTQRPNLGLLHGRWILYNLSHLGSPKSGFALNPMDHSSAGSAVPGIFQARILEWVAIPFSRGFSWSRDRTHVSCTVLSYHDSPLKEVYTDSFLSNNTIYTLILGTDFSPSRSCFILWSSWRCMMETAGCPPRSILFFYN